MLAKVISMDNEEFNETELFLAVPVKAVRDTNLKGKYTALILGEICSMIKGTGRFFMSNATLASRFNCSTRTIINAINELKKYGYITTKNFYKNNSKDIKYREIYIKDQSIFKSETSKKGSETEFTTIVKQNSSRWCNDIPEGSEPDFTVIDNNNRPTNRLINREDKPTEINKIIKHKKRQFNIYDNQQTGLQNQQEKDDIEQLKKIKEQKDKEYLQHQEFIKKRDQQNKTIKPLTKEQQEEIFKNYGKIGG